MMNEVWMVVLLPGALLAAFLTMPSVEGIRDRLLRAAVAWGVAACALTEGLGALRLLDRFWLGAAWSLWTAAALAMGLANHLRERRRSECSEAGASACQTGVARAGAGRRKRLPHFPGRADALAGIAILGCAALLTITALVAGFSPPNSADAMAYHMPRVVYWAEQGSVRFFPTPYLNQIMLQPMAEYLMLQSYLLSGGDRCINFIPWLASLGSMAAVSAIARRFGAGARGQAMAALFCATIPAGILASSGAKNDYLMAFWLACAVYFALRFASAPRSADALLLGCALGLALLTKATAYIFAPWPLVAILAFRAPKSSRQPGFATYLMLAAVCAAALNMPQYARNLRLSGSPLGFDSAQGDGYYRWRNETFGWKQTVSNVVRSTAEQLGARSQRWNAAVFNGARAIHEWLGLDIKDPATTWRGAVFGAPVNANHEANAPNRWQLAMLCAAGCVLLWQAARGRNRRLALYALGLACGYLAFCGYLKWQPFMARLVLPLFVLGAPLAALVEEVPSVCIQVALCLFLLNNARPAAFENWVRPLKGERSILHRDRDELYFADMSQWNDAGSYPAAVSALRQSGCGLVGIDINNFQLEYPLQALLREVSPRVLFIHTGVDNVSRGYAPPVSGQPCAIACLDCVGDTRRLDLYRDFQRRVTAGKFVVLLR